MFEFSASPTLPEKFQVGDGIEFPGFIDPENPRAGTAPEMSTIIRIVDKPESREKYAALVDQLIKESGGCAVMDGENLLDYEKIAEKVDPNKLYVLEH